MTTAHDPRSLEERLERIANWSEPDIDLADAGTAREALEMIRAQAAEIKRIRRAIERHEAYKQEVSDAVETFYRNECDATHRHLGRFIIPKPDPVTDWLHKSGYEGNVAVEQAVRAYAKDRGLEIREIGQ